MAKTVVTMTSWKKRINVLAKQIFLFFSTQTSKPDLFYLWLSETEFPKKEKDLPEKLLMTCEAFDVKIMWTPKNDYCFKRWYVFPKHYDDLVISIDDDIKFPSTLIAEAKKHINETNITYNIFKDLTFMYDYSTKEVRKFIYEQKISNRYRFLGCSVICPRSFPLKCVDEKLQETRREISKRDDQAWIKAFMIKNETMISYLPFSFKQAKISSIADKNATWEHFQGKIYGYRKENFQLHYILQKFPDLLECWVKAFPTYPLEFFRSHEHEIKDILER